MGEPTIRLSREDFDTAAEERRLIAGRTDIGAIVAFTGLCRDEGGALAALELEHYPEMAESELGSIAREALTRWSLDGLTIIHRYGTIRPGERIVLVLAAAKGRADAFAAAQFVMDYLKTRAPFWKKELRVDGAEGSWVEAKASDEEAARAWRQP
ncbi:MAG TPA: molybdenum cofactor biosynthesis protein MoaE [Methylocystis sp.]|nr:molybdenum cofactor biosynthesis protein MoaE [Methylocystis sp.]